LLIYALTFWTFHDPILPINLGTPVSLAARGSLAILVLLERIMTFWTFHMPILHINLATPFFTCARKGCQEK
jgi:hypothetical protein